MKELAIGALGSIIASFVLYLLSNLYNFNSNKQRLYNIDLALNYIYQIENKRGFPEDYDSIIHLIESLHSHVFEIHKSIYPLTMLLEQKKKKLLQTLLYDISKRCELCLFSTVGYRGQQEKEARLNNLQKIFYTKDSQDNNCSIVRLSLSLIKQFQTKDLFISFANSNMLPYKFADYENLIYSDSFKSDQQNNKLSEIDNIIQRDGLTKKEYNEKIQEVKTFIEKLKQDGVIA